jgi:signal transduction histidine kinase
MSQEKPETATILVVDDNPTNLQLLLDYLNELNFKTLIAKSGEGALRQAALAKPDIILLDIMMPGMDGFDTCRRLKEDPDTRDVPIIFMTALSDTEDKVKGFDLGAVDYITKPFSQKEVLARLNTQLTIQRQKRELAELNAMKDRFLSIIALDLKHVFDTMIGPSRRLAESFDIFSKKEIEFIAKRLHRSAQDTIHMLEQVMTWADIQQGEYQFRPETIDLFESVSEVVVTFREDALRKKLELTNTVEPGTIVYADPAMIRVILENLLSNAIRFTRSGGAVTIASRTEGDMEQVTVSDTGVGMSEKNLTGLFRIDRAYKKPGITGKEGAHLGLVICKEFVEKNGGRIEAESELDKGSTFRFTLPKAEDA